MAVNLDQIARQAAVIVAERAIPAGMLWIGRRAGMEIYRISLESHYAVNPYSFEHVDTPPVFGMRLNIDDYLPPDVWRLADEHGTLLYDCRQGRPLAARATD